MSQVESLAKPILLKLMRGVQCYVSEHNALLLARWVAMKVFVVECNRNADAVASPSERAEFMQTLEISTRMQIAFGHCGREGWETGYWRHSATIGSPGTFPKHPGKNIHSVVFGIGQLLVAVLHTSLPDPLIDLLTDTGSLLPIWPPCGGFNWPAAKQLSAEQANRVAHALDTLFRTENVIWNSAPSNWIAE